MKRDENNPTSPKRSLTKRRSKLLQGVSILLIVLIAWIVANRGHPERVRQSQTTLTTEYGALVNGTLYRATDVVHGENTVPTILACPVASTVERVLFRDDARLELYRLGNSGNLLFSVSDGAIRYGLSTVRQRDPMRSGFSGFTVGSIRPSSRRYLGEFACSKQRKGALVMGTSTQSSLPAYPLNIDTVRFRQVSERGGNVTDLATIRGTNLVLVGSRVFWNRAEPDTRLSVTHGADYWTEVGGHSDLMLTDLVSGKVQRVGSSLPSYCDLEPGNNGVLWTSARAYPDRSRDLIYSRAEDGSVYHICTLEAGQSPGMSIEDGDTLYWYLSGTRADHAIALMATDLKSGGVRTVFDRSDEPLASDWAVLQSQDELLTIAHGSLFCMVRSSVDQRQVSLARIWLDKHNRLEIVQKLPLKCFGCRFDQGYLYYGVLEAEPSIIPSFFSDQPPDREALYRIPIPK